MSFMPAECFLDTNLLVYAAAGRGEDESNRIRALELIEERDFGPSAQVLKEFFVAVTCKSAVRRSQPRSSQPRSSDVRRVRKSGRSALPSGA